MTVQTFQFPSRSSDDTYTVTVGANGHVHCTCPGFRSPSKCWHVREVADKLGLPQTSRSETKPLFTERSIGAGGWQPTHGDKAGAPPLGGTAVVSQPWGPGTALSFAPPVYDPTKQQDLFVEPMLGRALKEGERIEHYEGRPGWSLEVKYDGHRIQVHVDERRIPVMWSRDQNRWDVPRHLLAPLAQLAPGVYDGEIYLPGKTHTDVKRLDQRHKLKIVFFDITMVWSPDHRTYIKTWDFPLRERRNLLATAMTMVGGSDVVQAPWRTVQPRILQEVWDAGGEGVMLKNDEETYQPGMRRWVKIKKEQTARVTIAGFLPGKLGPCSRVVAHDDQGVEVRCKALDTAMRSAFERDPNSFVGRRLVISYTQKTVGKNKYQHPRCDHLE